MTTHRAKGSARILRAISAATLGITCLSDPAWAQPGGSGINGNFNWAGQSTFGTFGGTGVTQLVDFNSVIGSATSTAA